MFAAIPLLALPVLVYNLYALSLPGMFQSSSAAASLGAPVFSFKTTGGTLWTVSLSDLLLAVSLVILFIELLKATTSRRTAIVNHSLSMLLFVTCLVEMLLLPAFANSVFFLLSLMVLLDVLAGFIVTIVASRRDIDLTNER